MGAAERPDVAKTQSRGGSRGGPPTWPEGVDFYAHRPNSRSSKQVIVIPDDARGIVVAEAYASGSSKPLIRKEFTLAKPRKPR
jgi:hypothetical protein